VDNLFIATLAGVLILLASMTSIEFGLSVAIIEIVLGVIGGNWLGLHTTPWIDFLAGFASIVLTFLAGAEVDPDLLREKWKESLAIGGISFLAPFLGAMALPIGCCTGAGRRPRLPESPFRPPRWLWSTPCWSRPA
jgi:Kef-type K+ transport system membrane component KefB